MTQANTQDRNKWRGSHSGLAPIRIVHCIISGARGIHFRIFGRPMTAWSDQMPKGMRLKSEGYASSLADPKDEFTLAEYSKQEGLPYQDLICPCRWRHLSTTGWRFKRSSYRTLKPHRSSRFDRPTVRFELRLADGELFIRAQGDHGGWDNKVSRMSPVCFPELPLIL